jgi:YhcH/YjgK/YiaL family protein
MIIDKLENAALYSGISDRLAAAFKFLTTSNFSTMEVGRYEIKGDEVFAMVSEYQTKNLSDAKWEAHEKYADVQFVISGQEQMGYAPLNQMEVKEAYRSEKDIVILKGTGDYVTATPNTFLVFFPHDAHQPCVSVGSGCKVKKVVVKVKI